MTDATDAASMSLMRNLGRFVGHVVAAVRAEPPRDTPRTVRRSVETERRPGGVILRRTVIEEVEMPAPRDAAGRTDDHAS